MPPSSTDADELASAAPFRVIVIADNASVLRRVSLSLGEAIRGGCRVESMSGSEAGLAALSRETYDLCLLHHQMGGGQGLTVMKTARASGCRVPFLVLLDQAADTLEMSAIAQGADECVPLDTASDAALERQVRRSVARARALDAERERDLTERRRLEDQLRQAQKMEAIGQLAGGVAHDFNNLLMVILGYCETLSLSLPEGGPTLGQVLEIKKAGSRAAQLTQQLLAFSRRQILQPKVIDLNWIIADTDRMLRRLIGENIVFRTKLASELRPVKADPGQIQQVLLNLVVNARDAMPDGGAVTIETANVQLDATYLGMVHSSLKAGGYVMLSVTDTGTGMDAETLSHLFEPFFTTKGLKGTGLGLATVYGVVQQSGGDILPDSEPGRGTTFRIYLPQATADLAEQRLETPAALAGEERVLIVEDEGPVRALVTAMLRRQGYDVLEAASAEEALALEEKDGDDIDLLVADVVMPGLSGTELTQRMKDLRPRMKVLFISGHTDHVQLRNELHKPGVHFLQKPFTATALGRKVRDVLDGLLV
ncbi:MAG: response regulator [Acidobacteria bacterium]|nr:response regulator [Acidobacteriota bacterium]